MMLMTKNSANKIDIEMGIDGKACARRAHKMRVLINKLPIQIGFAAY